jgi:hypothetical protein
MKEQTPESSLLGQGKEAFGVGHQHGYPVIYAMGSFLHAG